MKRILLFIVLLSTTCLYSQNLQLHYDFGEDREYLTTTLEMFKPDEYGSFFFFVDMDYNYPGNKSMAMGYWEIARYINSYLIKNLSLTIQYNDGIMAIKDDNGSMTAFPLGQAWLGGFTYPVNLGFITLNTELLYRQARGSAAPDIQITFVWFKLLFKDKINFTGYFDYWTQDNINGDKMNVFQAEPQLWYILTRHMAIGGEVEISKNFLPYSGWKFMPTLGIRWEF